MKKTHFIITIAAVCFLPLSVNAQSSFSVDDYAQFLQNNQNLSGDELISRHAPDDIYYSGRDLDDSLKGFAFLDSISIKYELTDDELALLKKNHFVVTERLSFYSYGHALHNIYGKDLPVFVTTDAVLQALHASYDRILMDLERAYLEPSLSEFLDALYTTFPRLAEKYADKPDLLLPLEDVDIYVTMAKSLLDDQASAPQIACACTFDPLWAAVGAEQLAIMPLFSEHIRNLDFSQFTVRGHYTEKIGGETLGPYFKSMMWLGRMDFLLTPPPAYEEEPWSEADIRRMCCGALLLDELIDMAGVRSVLDTNNAVIDFMVGESDNLTPSELSGIIDTLGLDNPGDLFDAGNYAAFQKALTASSDNGQRILSNFFIMDPFSAEPDALPISFRLMGQRFILDSYIFSNVVYDRIVYESQKIWRPMPDPLDALFVIGNGDALPLLTEELNRYKYSAQLSGLRYLVDAYDADYWQTSLYNVWLQAIRTLNPTAQEAAFPFFMQTTAWHQEKMNTQLASWAQLRHDTLLYAKQSYTGGTLCSYPHSYVEPYPAFYRQIATFAERAGVFMNVVPSATWPMSEIKEYFTRLGAVMLQLETIAQKELDRVPFTGEEIEFLQKMLFVQSGSGMPPFSGWYADIYYVRDDAAEYDYPIADVHTQPTDEFGGVVGNVLHVGTGNVNLGIFLADSPSDAYQSMAFVGPVMSYYETVTSGFDRLTDERWLQIVTNGKQPERPDWVNSYLADTDGNARPQGRELPGVPYSDVAVDENTQPGEISLLRNYPNPFNPTTTIAYNLGQSGHVLVTVYDVLGRKVATLVDEHRAAGAYTVEWNAGSLASGIYMCRIQAGSRDQTIKMLLMR